MASIKLLQTNIEGDNHLDKMKALIEREQPEVMTFQELFEVDIPFFTQMGYEIAFIPTVNFVNENEVRMALKGLQGIGILSKYPIEKFSSENYFTPIADGSVPVNTTPEMAIRPVVSAEIHKDGKTFRIATTHFTWTPGGAVTEEQLRDLKNMITILDKLGSVILTGDFNAPRGRETFDTLAKKYKDNVPPEAQTSIDQKLHRVTGLMFMVDGFFTSPEYTATNVRMIDGVSDHIAVIGEVSTT